MAFRRCNPVPSRLVRRRSDCCVVISDTILPSRANALGSSNLDKAFNINTISKLCPAEKIIFNGLWFLSDVKAFGLNVPRAFESSHHRTRCCRCYVKHLTAY